MTLKKHFEDWVEPRRWSLSLKKLIMHRHMPLQGMCQVILFDVLNDLGNDDYVATYLKEKGYEVTKKENNK